MNLSLLIMGLTFIMNLTFLLLNYFLLLKLMYFIKTLIDIGLMDCCGLHDGTDIMFFHAIEGDYILLTMFVEMFFTVW